MTVYCKFVLFLTCMRSNRLLNSASLLPFNSSSPDFSFPSTLQYRTNNHSSYHVNELLIKPTAHWEYCQQAFVHVDVNGYKTMRLLPSTIIKPCSFSWEQLLFDIQERPLSHGHDTADRSVDLGGLDVFLSETMFCGYFGGDFGLRPFDALSILAKICRTALFIP